MTPQWLPSGLWIRAPSPGGGGRELGRLSLAVGDRLRAAPSRGTEGGGRDRGGQTFLGSSNRWCNEGFWPQTAAQGRSGWIWRILFPLDKSPGKCKVSIWAKPGTCLHCLGWDSGARGPQEWLLGSALGMIIPHPWELVTPNTLGWVAGPLCPQEAAARLMSRGRVFPPCCLLQTWRWGKSLQN